MNLETHLKPMSRNVWIIIPAYEEEATVGQVIDRLKEEGFDQIMVVDDASETIPGKLLVERS